MNQRLVRASVLAIAVATAGTAALAQGRGRGPTDGEAGGFTPPRWTYDYKTQIPAVRPVATVKPGFTFAAAGDMIYGLPILPRQDAGVEALAKVVRGADAALANQEGSILDIEHFSGYLEAENGGGYPVGKPELAKDIAGLGFDFANKANNHAMDYGHAGLLESRKNLQDAGLKTPGVGNNRFLARAAQIMDTPHGRVAVIGAASTFPDSAPAGGAEGITGGRPGISVVHTRKIALVTEAQMVGIRVAAAGLGGRSAPDAKQVNLAGTTFRVADKPGFTYEINDVDRFEILRTVRGVKNIADMAVFTIHAHENAGMGDDRVPADFQQALYHDVIEAGGDIVSVHGPHLTRGIEIYKGKPIFYGLGHFVFQMLGSAPSTREMFEQSGTDPRFVANGDSDARGYASSWYDGAVAVTEFGAGGAVKEIRLYPIDLREKELMKSRGIPQLATGEKAKRVLEQIQKDSVQYGTRITIESGVGFIRPSA
jgi:poly-gamma-glutamate capsule biosynthesis protein CapA/YwtB (metallophosphatase superfamily)